MASRRRIHFFPDPSSKNSNGDLGTRCVNSNKCETLLLGKLNADAIIHDNARGPATAIGNDDLGIECIDSLLASPEQYRPVLGERSHLRIRTLMNKQQQMLIGFSGT